MSIVTKGVFFIQGQDEFLPDSHVYIVGEPDSNDLSIIDAGLTGKGAYKLKYIQNMGIELSSIKRIIMTHTHLDHIGCFSEIKKVIPHLELWVHESEAELLEKGDDRGVYGMDDFKGMCQSQFGLKSDSFNLKVDRKLEGNETLEIGNMIWDVIHVPGHSMGGIALHNPSLEILIPGDVVYADNAIGRFDLFGANPEELKKSLSILAGLKVDILLPGHNQIVKGLPEGYIKKVAKTWEPYIV